MLVVEVILQRVISANMIGYWLVAVKWDYLPGLCISTAQKRYSHTSKLNLLFTKQTKKVWISHLKYLFAFD